MLKILSEPARTVVATAAYTGLRRSELRGLIWEGYQASIDEDSLGLLQVTRSVWRSSIGDPKAPVPIIQQLAESLRAHWERAGKPATGPIFTNGLGKPLCLDWLYRSQMKDILKRAGLVWKGWHAFRRGLASNLNRLGVDDSVIQSILRHSTVSVTQNHYIKTARPEAIAAMKQFSQALMCSSCAPNQTENNQPVIQ